MWPFLVPARSGEADTSWSSINGFSSDGRADLVVTSQAGDAGSDRPRLPGPRWRPPPGPTLSAARPREGRWAASTGTATEAR
ncbi:MAG: hypothetical protein IPF99_43390 [Deltaproteobacteria bacterium]|nr:hypothetical protein [Deltaproteobacteria bacterium]